MVSSLKNTNPVAVNDTNEEQIFAKFIYFPCCLFDDDGIFVLL